jgi:peptidoglycan/xylan/chitin deacetylase (PgdA/CDA1 family)
MNTQRVPVLMYHRVGNTDDSWSQNLCISPHNFRAQMHKLANCGFTPCGIDDFINWLNGHHQLPEKSFLITFDDGYAGVYNHAFPVLSELNWTATLFLVTGLIGKQDVWCQLEDPSEKSYSLMNTDQIMEMVNNGFTFHSHSRNHDDLKQLDTSKLESELQGSREDLESLLNKPAPYLAYPFGRYNDKVVSAARHAGYKAAFCVQPGFNQRGTDPFAIRRIDVYGTDTPAHLLRKVTYGTNNGSWRESLKYYYKQLRRRLKG